MHLPVFSSIFSLQYTFWCNHSKILTEVFYHGVISPKDTESDGMANSEEPSQTVPKGAV